MKYVIDSSVGLKWELPELDSPKALAIRNDFTNWIHELIAPDVYAIEVAHAITRAERQSILTPSQGTLALGRMMGLLPTLFQSLPLLQRAYEISSKARIGVYDCLYVALAEREGCKLLTADQRLINSLRKEFSFLTDLADT